MMKTGFTGLTVLTLLLAGSLSQADCYAYRNPTIKNGSLSCSGQSEKLATLCVSAQDVKALTSDIPNLSSGTFKITIQSVSGQLMVSSIYHVSQTRQTASGTTTDYRPAVENFKLQNAESVPYYAISTTATSPNAAVIKMGGRHFCGDKQ